MVGTHTHIPTNDARILSNGTGYQTDAGMCGDYDSVIGMNKENSLNRFLKKNSVKHFPACLLYTSPSPRDRQKSRMPSSA